MILIMTSDLDKRIASVKSLLKGLNSASNLWAYTYWSSVYNELTKERSINKEYGGPKGPEPTRFGTWEHKGREIDF